MISENCGKMEKENEDRGIWNAQVLASNYSSINNPPPEFTRVIGPLSMQPREASFLGSLIDQSNTERWTPDEYCDIILTITQVKLKHVSDYSSSRITLLFT